MYAQNPPACLKERVWQPPATTPDHRPFAQGSPPAVPGCPQGPLLVAAGSCCCGAIGTGRIARSSRSPPATTDRGRCMLVPMTLQKKVYKILHQIMMLIVTLVTLDSSRIPLHKYSQLARHEEWRGVLQEHLALQVNGLRSSLVLQAQKNRDITKTYKNKLPNLLYVEHGFQYSGF